MIMPYSYSKYVPRFGRCLASVLTCAGFFFLQTSVSYASAEPPSPAPSDIVLAAAQVSYDQTGDSFLNSLVEQRPGDMPTVMSAAGFGSKGDYEQNQHQGGFSDWIYGAAFKLDGIFRERYLLGAWATFAGSQGNGADASNVDTGFQMGGLYAGLKTGRFYFGILGGGGLFQSNTDRFNQSRRVYGSFDGSQVVAGADLKIALLKWSSGSFMPSVAAHYMETRFTEFNESGDAGRTVDEFSVNSVFIYPKVQFDQLFKLPWDSNALWLASAGWRKTVKGGEYEVDAATGAAPTPKTTEQMGPYSRGAMVFRTAVKTRFSETTGASLSYEYELGTNRSRHVLELALQLRW